MDELLSAGDITLINQATRDALLAAAQAHAVGGGRWTATDATGNGISEPIAQGPARSVELSILQVTRPVLVSNEPPVFEQRTEWQLRARSGTAIQVGTQLRSQASPMYSFGILSLDDTDPSGVITGIVGQR